LAEVKITTSNQKGIYSFIKQKYGKETEFLDWRQII
jgi:hypothetical protein